jgi:hypothetical protein
MTPGGPRLLGLHVHFGNVGTVIGDFCSHNMGLDDAGASILLSPIVAVLFLAGRGGRLLLLPFYWLTSTAVTGALFVALLVIWREQSRSEREIAIAS